MGEPMECRTGSVKRVVERNVVQNAIVAAKIYVGIAPLTTAQPALLLRVHNRFKALLNRLRWQWLAIVREESGQDMIEYALLTALIALAVIAGIRTVAAPINSSYSVITSKFHKHVGKHLGQSK